MNRSVASRLCQRRSILTVLGCITQFRRSPRARASRGMIANGDDLVAFLTALLAVALVALVLSTIPSPVAALSPYLFQT